MRIREALAGNDDLPPAFGIPLADRIRQHLPFSWTAFRDLRQADVALLLQAPYQRLLEALPFEQYISDSSVRKAFIQGVRDHKIRSSVWSCPEHRKPSPLPCADTGRNSFPMTG